MHECAVTADLREHLQATLSGSYTLERELGGGGMARLFLAQETALGRSVVVKVLAPDLAQELSVERFAREIRVSARLQHPNIIPVLSAGVAAGVPYYTMPYIEGESLRVRLERGVAGAASRCATSPQRRHVLSGAKSAEADHGVCPGRRRRRTRRRGARDRTHVPDAAG